MPAHIHEITKSNVLPENTFSDNYIDFIGERSKMLESEAAKLLE